MPRQMILASAAAAAVAVMAPVTALAAVKSRISISAPKTVKVNQRYTIKIAATFDARLDGPPTTWVMAKSWRHSGSAPCPTKPPVNRSGWTVVLDYTFTPKHSTSDDKPVKFINQEQKAPKVGAYRYCGYIVQAHYPEPGATPIYDVKARGTALTRAKR